MIDTVKLLIPVENPSRFFGSKFTPVTPEELARSTNYGKTMLNPSVTYKKIGKYMPRLTLFKRLTKFGPVYQLAIEFSAPKMLYGNNFDEITEADFPALVTAVIDKTTELVGRQFNRSEIINAEIGAWHATKNIVFLNYIACQTILNTINKLDVSKVYDFQKDRYRDGGNVLHIHCNSLDIAFYDKIIDLRKSRKSEKRSFEKDNLVQLSLLNALEKLNPLEVLRYEVRLVGKRSVQRAFSHLNSWTFQDLYKAELNKQLLQEHWKSISSNVGMLSLDVKQPYELFTNYIEEHDDITPNSALAATAGLIITSQVGVSDFRNLLEKRFGKHSWQRLKKSLVVPGANRFMFFVHIDEALENFQPVKLTELIKNY